MDFYGKDFLKILDFNEDELRYILGTAKKFKEMKKAGQNHNYFPNKNIALLFEKTSTRTRCSFEVAARDLGMGVTYLDPTCSQMGHKESIADTARVLSRFYDGIGYRGYGQEAIEELAKYSDVPVWNGLTDEYHPTQALSDFMTIEEHFGKLKGLTLAYVGNTRNNVANSLMAMSTKMGMNFIACGPEALRPAEGILAACQPIAVKNGTTILLTSDMNMLNKRADIVYTDVWLSMGEDKAKWGERISLLQPYQVTMDVMNRANDGAIFLHCLPAFHDLNTSIAKEVNSAFGLTEMEVTDEVFNSEKSLVFEQAENRLHTIKSVVFLSLWGSPKKSASEGNEK